MWHLETQTWRGSQEGNITFGKERRSLDERGLWGFPLFYPRPVAYFWIFVLFPCHIRSVNYTDELMRSSVCVPFGEEGNKELLSPFYPFQSFTFILRLKMLRFCTVLCRPGTDLTLFLLWHDIYFSSVFTWPALHPKPLWCLVMPYICDEVLVHGSFAFYRNRTWILPTQSFRFDKYNESL